MIGSFLVWDGKGIARFWRKLERFLFHTKMEEVAEC